MFRKLLPIILSVIAWRSVFAQQQIGSDVAKGCAFSEVYRKGGWTIPGMPASPVEAKFPRKPYREMPGVFVTIMTPSPTETTITTIWCSSDPGGRLVVWDEPIGIISLLAFDFHGRVFAYSVKYVEEWISDGQRRQTAAESQAIFYDLDGSGHFTLKQGPGGPLVPRFIPEWAKKETVEHQ